jgi:K+-sensing histidine kinase KdpD
MPGPQIDHSLETGLSAAELSRLFEVLSIVPRMMIHDLRAPLNAIAANEFLLGQALEKMEEYLPDNPDVERLSERINSCRERTREQVARISLTYDTYLGSLTHVVSAPFVAVPYFIVRRLQEKKKDVDVAITSRSPKSLEMLYPSGVLAGVIAELVENARRHSKRRSRVRIGWSLQSSRFTCRFHDSAPAMLPRGFRGFADLQTLDLAGKLTCEKEGGLNMVHRVIAGSGGELLFSRSSLLGGNLIQFGFPLLRYRMSGRSAG